MSLTIRKLKTRCKSPRGFERAGWLVEDVARGPFAAELSAHLGPSLERLPAVIRLKDLRVGLKIPARNLNRASLAAAWARAFSAAIHRALAHPSGDGTVSLRRYSSEAAYRAALLHQLATRGLEVSWEFPELAALPTHSPFEAALDILLRAAGQIPGILEELNRQDRLEPLLAWWDELSLERILQGVAIHDSGGVGLSLDDLVELGRAAARPGGFWPQWPISSRRQAIRLWVRMQRRLPLRGIWHGIRLLRKLLEMPALPTLGDRALLDDSIPFPPWCESIVAGLAAPARGLPAGTTGFAPADLLSVLDELRPLVPSACGPAASGPAQASVTWIQSGCAGILLMLPMIRRLDLVRYIRQAEFVRWGGIRALSFLLAGIGMSLLEHWTPSDPIDPAVAAFAGMIGDPDLAGMRHFFSATNPGVIAEIGRGETWPEVLEDAGTALAAAFAARIRGFRKASRDAVVRQFLRVPGRILIEETRLVTIVESTPWAVALHLSGIDDPLESVEWLGGRRAEFVLEGL